MSTLQISWASCKATFGSSRLQYNQFLKVRHWGPGGGGKWEDARAVAPKTHLHATSCHMCPTPQPAERRRDQAEGAHRTQTPICC